MGLDDLVSRYSSRWNKILIYGFIRKIEILLSPKIIAKSLINIIIIYYFGYNYKNKDFQSIKIISSIMFKNYEFNHEHYYVIDKYFLNVKLEIDRYKIFNDNNNNYLDLKINKIKNLCFKQFKMINCKSLKNLISSFCLWLAIFYDYKNNKNLIFKNYLLSNFSDLISNYHLYTNYYNNRYIINELNINKIEYNNIIEKISHSHSLQIDYLYAKLSLNSIISIYPSTNIVDLIWKYHEYYTENCNVSNKIYFLINKILNEYGSKCVEEIADFITIIKPFYKKKSPCTQWYGFMISNCSYTLQISDTTIFK